MQNTWCGEIRKNNIALILKHIILATSQDKCLSLLKFSASCQMEIGLSKNKFDEYIQILCDAGKIKVDKDEVIAIFENERERTIERETGTD